MRALALHATENQPGKRDASGAFVPEAIAFQKHFACYREGFHNELPPQARREHVHAVLGRYRDLEMVAIFGHGLRRSLQTGHDLKTVDTLAKAIAAASGPRVYVPLFACSTAAKLTVARGGFADALRDALTKLGKTGHVDAHTIAAHTTRNPYVQRFDMGAPESEVVGDWLVEPHTALWDAWRQALQKTPLRLTFPTMSVEQVRAVLR